MQLASLGSWGDDPRPISRTGTAMTNYRLPVGALHTQPQGASVPCASHFFQNLCVFAGAPPIRGIPPLAAAPSCAAAALIDFLPQLTEPSIADVAALSSGTATGAVPTLLPPHVTAALAGSNAGTWLVDRMQVNLSHECMTVWRLYQVSNCAGAL